MACPWKLTPHAVQTADASAWLPGTCMCLCVLVGEDHLLQDLAPVTGSPLPPLLPPRAVSRAAAAAAASAS
jgi:hypothetical protein